MIISPIDNSNKDLIKQAHDNLEKILDADVFVYYGGLIDGGERTVRKIIEDLAKDPNKKEKIVRCFDNWRRKHQSCKTNREYFS